jgi:hypothetical protein
VNFKADYGLILRDLFGRSYIHTMRHEP